MDYDIFLSYNRSDQAAVVAIGEWLKVTGLRPWIDVWAQCPGEPWQNELERQIRTIRTVAVFVGPEGIGPWHSHEINAFLRQMVNNQCRVIPVLLPGCPSQPNLPIFLQGISWVDFRQDGPDRYAALIWGILGKPVSTPDLRNLNRSRKRLLTFVLGGAILGLTVATIYQWLPIPDLSSQIETPGAPSTGLARRKASVVFVDANGKHPNYGSNFPDNRISTAVFLAETVKKHSRLNQSIEAHFQLVDHNAPISGEAEKIQGYEPDLVVIHRSTFKDDVTQVEQRDLEELLSALRPSPTDILIFSRTAGTDRNYAADIKRRLGLDSHVFAYQFPEGSPFDKPGEVDDFLAYVDVLGDRSALCTRGGQL